MRTCKQKPHSLGVGVGEVRCAPPAAARARAAAAAAAAGAAATSTSAQNGPKAAALGCPRGCVASPFPTLVPWAASRPLVSRFPTPQVASARIPTLVGPCRAAQIAATVLECAPSI